MDRAVVDEPAERRGVEGADALVAGHRARHPVRDHAGIVGQHPVQAEVIGSGPGEAYGAAEVLAQRDVRGRRPRPDRLASDVESRIVAVEGDSDPVARQPGRFQLHRGEVLTEGALQRMTP